MSKVVKTSLHRYFDQFPDYRVSRNKKHVLSDIIILSVIAVICGAESWDSIKTFGNSKQKFLRKFLHLPNGIPSHDTINRVFSSLRPTLFEQMFTKWAQGIKDKAFKPELVSINCKCIQGSSGSFHGLSPFHMVSAWANDNQMVGSK